MPELCELCSRGRFPPSDLCEAHKAAEDNVIAGYEGWVKAFGQDITLQGYLERIISLPETGKEAKDVARHLLRKQAQNPA